ncbi:hypothetical protein M514_05455 [Trichuris suis]|uniref:Activin types I and II receptor domain-containing protein n=1 Tax=Trichuris suis TaxID=68888 RepID=A0A085M954_9BILA|nr:hypothetical protein M513_05455 [Trichuris suis]KFD72468.1 hypothetical protein M514_05455 [Trichuris suis]
MIRSLWAALQLLFVLSFKSQANAVRCFQCDNQYGTCNSGECTGLACIMIEAITNQKKSVQKGCLHFLDRSRCLKADLMGVETTKCTCSSDFCNDDEQLVKNDLVQRTLNTASSSTNPERSKRTNFGAGVGLRLTRNNLLMLIFMCLFITGSFSLLLFNTLCLQITALALIALTTI